MADEMDNHTLRLLQEMRSEMRENLAAIEQRFAGIEQRIDGNTLILNVIAGLGHDHEQRLTAIEGGRP